MKPGTPERAIYDAHKAATNAFYEEHGRYPNTSDSEYWEISDAYKASHQEIVDARKAEEKREERERAKEQENPVVAIASGKRKTVGERICKADDCTNIIQPTGKRGRPPVFCEDHRGDKSVKKVADELEIISD